MLVLVRHVFLLLGYHHFKEEDIALLVDDGSSSRQPTRATIIAAMKWLVKGANPHDSLFLHCEFILVVVVII